MMAVAMGICKTDHVSPSPPHSNCSPFYAARTKSENEIGEEGTGEIGGESEVECRDAVIRTIDLAGFVSCIGFWSRDRVISVLC